MSTTATTTDREQEREGEREGDSETAAAKQVKQPAGKSFQFPPCHRTLGGEEEGREGGAACYVRWQTFSATSLNR